MGIGPGDSWFTVSYQLPVFSLEALHRWLNTDSDRVVVNPSTGSMTRLLRVKTICQMEVVTVPKDGIRPM